MRTRSLIVALCLLATIPPARSGKLEEAQPERGRAVARITWLDEKDTPRQLADFAGYPVILLPLYTQCSATCPLNIAALKRALSDAGANPAEYRVLLFSFDASETADSLAELRKRENLPLSWAMGRANADNIEQLTQSIGFQFGTSGTEFMHPNIVLVLDAKLAIAKWIYGNNYGASDISNALLIAAGKSDWLGRHAATFYGLTLFAVSLLCVALVHFTLERKRLRRLAPPPIAVANALN